MTKKKEVSFKLIMLIMIFSLILAALWNSLPWLKDAIHYLLDPTAGALINWNLSLGMLVVVFLIAVLTTVIQKYTTDQEALKELKKEQKQVQEQLKKLERGSKEHQELTMKSFSSMAPMMKLSMRSFVYTGVPFILFFRWFSDFFTKIGDPIFFGIFNWFWFYLIFSIIFSSILRKWWDVA